MTDSKLLSIFESDITQEGLNALREKYPSTLVMDMSNDKNLTAARKIRTERNKLSEAIDRRRIDTTSDLKKVGDDLKKTVSDIYSVVVVPFELEDKRRKDLAEEAAKKKRELIAADKLKIDGLKGFIGQAVMSTSEQISGMIDAIENTDCSVFHKELIHEAMEAKEFALVNLGESLSQKLQSEQAQRENDELRAQLAQIEADKKPVEQPVIEEKEAPKKTSFLPSNSTIEPTLHTIEISINCSLSRALEIKAKLEGLVELETINLTTQAA